MNITRSKSNPIITPADVTPYHQDFEVIGAFNAGVAEYNGEILLILRVAERPLSKDPNIVKAPVYNAKTKTLELFELHKDNSDYDFSDPRVIRPTQAGQEFEYLTSLSYFRIARSVDGENFTIDDRPFLYPSNEYETFGIEDARVTQIGDTYYIYYTAVSPKGVGEAMVSTKDFVKTQYHGMIFAPENKDVLIFPEKINGLYYALHRPSLKAIGKPEMWIAESTNLLHWGNHKHLLALRPDKWDNGRIGGGAVPFKTEKGWLELYHGATPDNRYCMGAVLLDLDDPTKVIARSDRPILEPETDYERNGFFGQVVFSCGAVVRGDVVKMYYGVSDTSMACAELSLQEILNSLVC